MSAPERFDVRSYAPADVGTHDFVQGRPTLFDTKFRFQLVGDGNYSLTVLASDMDPAVPANFLDITSIVAGGALITANGFYTTDRLYGAVRLNVTSIQSAKHLNISGSWM